MVPMRDGVRLATDVYLPEGRRPVPGGARAAALRQERPLLLDAVHRHALHRARLRLPAPGRARQVPLRGRARSPSSTRCPTATTRSSGSSRSRGRTATSACGATATTASRSGPRSPAGTPRSRRSSRASRSPTSTRWLEGVTPLYGAHYLAEYWTDHNTNEWTPDWSQRPLAEVFDAGVRGDRPPLARRSTTCWSARAAARGCRCSPAPTRSTCCASRRCTASAGSTTSRRPHMLDYEALIAEPRDGAVPVPARGLDGSRELPASSRARSPSRTTTRGTTTRWSRCSALHRARRSTSSTRS